MGEVTLRSKGVVLVCLHTCRQTRPRTGPGPYAVVTGLPGDNQVEYVSIRQNARNQINACLTSFGCGTVLICGGVDSRKRGSLALK